MLILGLVGMYGSVVIYILLHGMVKGQIFQISRYIIHGNGRQDIRENIRNNFIYLICVGIFILSAISGIVIMIAKELMVINIFGVMMVIVVYISYMYTLIYVNKSGNSYYVRELERFYVILLMFVSISIVNINFSV